METLHKDSKKQIGQFVADDFRTAAIFSKYGIDFCCKGDRTIEEVCKKNDIETDELLGKLYEVSMISTNQSIDYKSWPLDLLIDYIEKKHHRYVEEKIPVILQFLNIKAKQRIQKAIPVFVIIIGLLFIIRGLGLDIPYLSPAPNTEIATGQIECH